MAIKRRFGQPTEISLTADEVERGIPRQPIKKFGKSKQVIEVEKQRRDIIQRVRSSSAYKSAQQTIYEQNSELARLEKIKRDAEEKKAALERSGRKPSTYYREYQEANTTIASASRLIGLIKDNQSTGGQIKQAIISALLQGDNETARTLSERLKQGTISKEEINTYLRRETSSAVSRSKERKRLITTTTTETITEPSETIVTEEYYTREVFPGVEIKRSVAKQKLLNEIAQSFKSEREIPSKTYEKFIEKVNKITGGDFSKLKDYSPYLDKAEKDLVKFRKIIFKVPIIKKGVTTYAGLSIKIDEELSKTAISTSNIFRKVETKIKPYGLSLDKTIFKPSRVEKIVNIGGKTGLFFTPLGTTLLGSELSRGISQQDLFRTTGSAAALSIVGVTKIRKLSKEIVVDIKFGGKKTYSSIDIVKVVKRAEGEPITQAQFILRGVKSPEYRLTKTRLQKLLNKRTITRLSKTKIIQTFSDKLIIKQGKIISPGATSTITSTGKLTLSRLSGGMATGSKSARLFNSLDKSTIRGLKAIAEDITGRPVGTQVNLRKLFKRGIDIQKGEVVSTDIFKLTRTGLKRGEYTFLKYGKRTSFGDITSIAEEIKIPRLKLKDIPEEITLLKTYTAVEDISKPLFKGKKDIPVIRGNTFIQELEVGGKAKFDIRKPSFKQKQIAKETLEAVGILEKVKGEAALKISKQLRSTKIKDIGVGKIQLSEVKTQTIAKTLSQVKVMPKTESKSIVRTQIKVMPKTETKSIVKTETKVTPKIISKSIVKVTPKTLTKVTPKTQVKTTTKQATKIVTKQVTKLITKYPSKLQGTPYIPKKTSGITPIPIIPPMKKLKEEEEYYPGFYTYVIRKGKRVKLSGIRPKGLALRRGVKETRGTLAATFGIIPAGKVKQRDINYIPSQKEFRSYRIKKGRKAQSNVYIQRTTTEKGLPGGRLRYKAERRALQLARI